MKMDTKRLIKALIEESEKIRTQNENILKEMSKELDIALKELKALAIINKELKDKNKLRNFTTKEVKPIDKMCIKADKIISNLENSKNKIENIKNVDILDSNKDIFIDLIGR